MVDVLCDHMLGSLATWLRILGVNTAYPSNTVSDDEILQQAKREGRLILTRDKALVARAKKAGIPVLHITSTDLDTQLKQTIEVVPLDSSQMLSRCTICNAVLKPVTPQEAASHVPPRVSERQARFWFCAACQKYYWQGTHYEAMEKRIKILMNQKR